MDEGGISKLTLAAFLLFLPRPIFSVLLSFYAMLFVLAQGYL